MPTSVTPTLGTQTIAPLFQHQEAAADFIVRRGGSGALFMDMGTGKTRTTVEIFRQLRETTPALKMIVLCPLSLIESAWGEDVAKFSDFTMWNAREDGIPAPTCREDIVILNFETAIQAKNLSRLVDLVRGNLLVIDESSRMKDHKSKTTKLILFLRKLPALKIILSGTPAPNSPLEYWAQMEFLQDWVLHKSFYAFRNNFFHLERNGQRRDARGMVMTREAIRSVMQQGWKYAITQENLAALMQRIEPLIFRVRKEDCLDLPDKVDEVRRVELTHAQAVTYRDMKRDLIAEIRGSCVTAQVALTKLMKLREITSGFAIDTEGKAVAIGSSAKLNELEDVLAEIGERPVIIWAVFQWDVERIVELIEAKYGTGSVVALYGNTKDPLASIDAFKMGHARYLVANPHSAGHGLTFVNCSTQVFFSLDYSWEYYEQAKARIHRAGQTQKCTYVHLIAKHTIDEQILSALRTKGDVNEIVEGMLR